MRTANAKGAPGTHKFRMSSDCMGRARSRRNGFVSSASWKAGHQVPGAKCNVGMVVIVTVTVTVTVSGRARGLGSGDWGGPRRLRSHEFCQVSKCRWTGLGWARWSLNPRANLSPRVNRGPSPNPTRNLNPNLNPSIRLRKLQGHTTHVANANNKCKRHSRDTHERLQSCFFKYTQ